MCLGVCHPPPQHTPRTFTPLLFDLTDTERDVLLFEEHFEL